MFKHEERGVSPIVATVLLLAITVTIAALVLVFVGRIAAPETPPSAVLAASLERWYDNDNVLLSISHSGGDILLTGELKVSAQNLDGTTFQELTTSMDWATEYKSGEITSTVYDPSPTTETDPVGQRLIVRVVHTPSGTLLMDTKEQVIAKAAPAPDDEVTWAGVYHTSRDDSYYRDPQGTYTGDPPSWYWRDTVAMKIANADRDENMTFRIRTFAYDVTSVNLRIYDEVRDASNLDTAFAGIGGENLFAMTLENRIGAYDYWAVTVIGPKTEYPDNGDFGDNASRVAFWWYGFQIYDGADGDGYGEGPRPLTEAVGMMLDTTNLSAKDWLVVWE